MFWLKGWRVELFRGVSVRSPHVVDGPPFTAEGPVGQHLGDPSRGALDQLGCCEGGFGFGRRPQHYPVGRVLPGFRIHFHGMVFGGSMGFCNRAPPRLLSPDWYTLRRHLPEIMPMVFLQCCSELRVEHSAQGVAQPALACFT